MVAISFCQMLRVVSFTATQLPSPSRHCQPGVAEPLDWPQRPLDWLVVNVPRQASHGCGDLVFSSHVTFGLVFALTIWHYSTQLASRFLMVLLVIAQIVGILGARKHYTVDIVVALYVVPLVWGLLLRHMPDAHGKALPMHVSAGGHVEPTWK